MYSGNPDLQNLVANISLNTLGYDAYLGEMAKLAELYNTDSKWWKENQNGDPAILNRTLDYIEVGLKSFASKLYDEDDIDGAYAKYVEYLDKFPFADDYYDIKWYSAVMQDMSENKDFAILEKIYDDMMKSIDFHNYGHLVKYQQTRVYLNKVTEETDGVYHEKLADAEIIEERELPSGNFVKKYALSENMIRFIRSLDNLYEVDFEYEYAQAQDRLNKSQAKFKEAEDSGAEVIVVKKLSDRVDYDQTF